MLVSTELNATNTTVQKLVLQVKFSSPIWYIIICLVISFFCILGNGCVIYLIKTRSTLHDISNSFILSLAVSDLLVGVIVFPSKLACEILPTDQLLQRVFSELLMYWSIYNLFGMTIERFVFIVLPMKHQFYMTKRKTMILIFLCWLIPLVNFALHFTWLYSKAETKKFWLKNFTAIETITMVGFPAVVLVVLYIKIFTVAQRHRKITANQIGSVSFNMSSNLELNGSDSYPNLCAKYSQELSSISDEGELRLKNHKQERRNFAQKIDIRDKTSARSANTDKCKVNETPTEQDLKLENVPATMATKDDNSFKSISEKRKDFEVNPESDNLSTMLKVQCQENCSRVDNIDKVGQTGVCIRQNDRMENNPIDSLLNKPSTRDGVLIGRNEMDTDVEHVPDIETNLRGSPVTECRVRKSPIIEAHASKRPTPKTCPKRSQTAETESTSVSCEETTTYLEPNDKVQILSNKSNKRSIKKRLTNLIQRKRRSGASVVGAVIAVFLICWGVALYGSICHYFELCLVFAEIKQVSWILLLSNSAVNPVVYAMLKTDLRKEFANLIRCRRQR